MVRWGMDGWMEGGEQQRVEGGCNGVAILK